MPSVTQFQDRVDAGRRLADHLMFLKGEDVVVLGLPRGGVPVAFEVARKLGAPLDAIIVRKLGLPFQPELGMGAIGEEGVKVLNERVMKMAGITQKELEAVETQERFELERRAARLRHSRRPTSLRGRTAVVIDDGMATGSTARAACLVAKARGAERVVLAVPVASPEAIVDLGSEVELVCLVAPRNLTAVGQWYQDFSPTSEEDVIALLEGDVPIRAIDDRPLSQPEVEILADSKNLGGSLVVPPDAKGIVIFAHGSGSSRHSPRNRFVANRLNADGMATLLFDLLTPSEEGHPSKVFDIDLLAKRLIEVTDWVRQQRITRNLPIGYFGASTGAAAALCAASDAHSDVRALVSRGGRPDLARSHLERVFSPTLLIVGSRDTEVLHLNRQAQSQLKGESRLVLVPGATHLFEEPGALSVVAYLANTWFRKHLIIEHAIIAGPQHR